MRKDSKSKVLFVVLNFNGWKDSITCINTILEQDYKNFHTILIDNGSHDKSLSKLGIFSDHKKITLYKQPINLGFAGGVNIGIRHAMDKNYDYVVLLNNDAALTPSWLSTLMHSIQKYNSSSATGLLLYKNGKKIDSTGDGYSRWGLPFPRQRDEKSELAHDSGFVFSGTAGASLYKTELFRNIGLFDERFFAYFEDADMGFRAQLAGHKAYYEKNAIAYHDHGSTSGKMPGFTVYQSFKNMPQVILKNVPLTMLPGYLLRFSIWYWYSYCSAALKGNIIPATSGLLRSLLMIPGSLRRRHGIQKNRVATNTDLRKTIYSMLPPNTSTALRSKLSTRKPR